MAVYYSALYKKLKLIYPIFWSHIFISKSMLKQIISYIFPNIFG